MGPSEEAREHRRALMREWRRAHPGYTPPGRQDRAALPRPPARGRSPESMDRRREYVRAWRAAHPGYAPPGRSRPDLPEIPPLHVGHPLFDLACSILPGRDHRAEMMDPTMDDARSEVVLALLEGRDPEEAARSFLASEVRWRRTTGPLLIE